jgi:maltose alpha-D-glucosyltransferase/alpha-amylase
VYGYQRVNVNSQERDPSSLLKWTARQLELRRAHPAFAHGDLTFVNTANPAVLAFIRQHENETLLIVSNFAGNAQAATLDLTDYVGRMPVTLAGGSHFPPVTEGAYPMTLGKYDYYWMRLN